MSLSEYSLITVVKRSIHLAAVIPDVSNNNLLINSVFQLSILILFME